MADLPAGRVLVVDDAIVVRTVVRYELQAHGYEVIEAADGVSGLSLLREHSPDAVLLDIEMPGLDGYAVLAVIKDDPATRETPVIFLTARSESSEVADALTAGAYDYLRKPVDEVELVARVRSAVRMKRLQDELRQTNAELEAMSRTDWLTSLPNRRHIEEHLESIGGAAVRRGQPMSVLMVDVDHFKAINDSVGHDRGDDVLREIARRLKAGLRIEDIVGRWGGEEFLVVLPQTPAAAAAVSAERLRATVASHPIDGRDVTVSIGLAELVGSTAETVVRADGALYEAKAAGRDTVRAAV